MSALTKEGLNAVQVDYTDKDRLVSLLRGVHTVLSFVVVASDPGNIAQKNLIDASVEAGVKKFAPNEWGTYVLKLLNVMILTYRDAVEVIAESLGMQERMRYINTFAA